MIRRRKLRSIELLNFGKHLRKRVDLSPGITTICGRNAAGKSWIVRAFRWMSSNKPAGSAFINWNKSKTRVILRMSGGVEIVRNKSKRTNEYIVKKGTQRDVYTAFGAGIPDNVSKIIGIEDINFQGQHDAPYWFCKSPSEVSRQLNEIINLDQIDAALQWLYVQKLNATIKIRESEQRIDQYQDALDNMKYLDDMGADFDRLDELDIRATTAQQLADGMLSRCERYSETLKDYNRKAGISKLSQELERAYNRWLELDAQVSDLEEYIDTIDESETVIARLPSDEHVNGLEISWNKWITSKERAAKLMGLMEDITCQLASIKSKRVEEAKLQKRMDEIMKGRCPICGRKL